MEGELSGSEKIPAWKGMAQKIFCTMPFFESAVQLVVDCTPAGAMIQYLQNMVRVKNLFWSRQCGEKGTVNDTVKGTVNDTVKGAVNGTMRGEGMKMAAAKAGIKITDLTVNYMREPLGIGREDIVFSWKMQSPERGRAQEAYEMIVQSREKQVVWDSGKVETNRSVGIRYEGKALESGTRYEWQVIVWANDGQTYSAESSFETGVSGDDLWEKTCFISLDGETEAAPVFRTEEELGNPAAVAEARMYITAVGVYKAWINGQAVGEDVHMAPGYGDGSRSIAYQSYDVTELIRMSAEKCASNEKCAANEISPSDEISASDKISPSNEKCASDEISPSSEIPPSGAEEPSRIAVSIMVGTGWLNREGQDVMDTTLNRVGVKMLLRVKYLDGTVENIVTRPENWYATLQGPVSASGIFYGEDYHAGKELALGAYKYSGYCYDERWIPVTVMTYVGKILEGVASTGKILPDFTRYPQEVYTYSGCVPDSAYAGGEVKVDRRYVPEDLAEGIFVKRGQTAIVNMGQNLAAIPHIRMKGVLGETVMLKFGEMLNDGSRVNPEFVRGSHDASGPKGSLYTHSLRDARVSVKYTFGSDQTEEYQTLMSFFGYQYIEVTATCDILIYGLESRAISSLTKQTGFIQTNNAHVNRLFYNALYGQLSNYFTMITDCPQRNERKAWTGDAQVFSQTALYNFDALAFHREYQEKLAASTGEKGYPAAVLSLWDYFGNWASGWSDVLIINVWVMYGQSGDRELIRKNWDMMNRYMAYLKAHERGAYMAPAQDTTGYGDWLAFQGTAYEVMADYNYGYVTLLMEKMAAVLGDKEREQYYRAYFAQLKNAFLKNHVTYAPKASGDRDELVIRSGTGSLVMQNKGGVLEDNSQTSLIWMLKLGYYTCEDMKNTAIRLLVENIRNENPSPDSVRSKYGKNSLAVGFLGVNTIAGVLTATGNSQVAYDLLLNTECPSWLFEVKSGATTIWERWNSYSKEEGFGDCEMNSYNHFSYGSVVEWMYQYMAGIAWDEDCPGFQNIILQPTPDVGTQYNEEERIRSVEAFYESYCGRIVSNWESEDGRLRSYYVELPANTTADLYLPAKEAAAEDDSCVTFLGETWHHGQKVLKYRLLSGTHRFTINS